MSVEIFVYKKKKHHIWKALRELKKIITEVVL